MSADPTATRFEQGDGSEDSTQRGCTSWLLISIIVLTWTTAFVFGWGLAAPNMYNSYTEPFLKDMNPCDVQSVVQSHANHTQFDAAISHDGHPINKRQVENPDDDIDHGDEDDSILPIVDKQEEAFDFRTELIKGIPQTVFLIGAFIGALTGPFWVKFFDRKRTVFANYVFCFGSSLCVLLSYYKGYRFLFYLSRLLLGYQGKEPFA